MKNYCFALLLAVFLIPAASCRKTDKMAEQVNNQPFLVTTGFSLSNYNLPDYKFQTSYLVGDTAALLGKFFLDKPGFKVQVGNSAAQIIFKTQVPVGLDSSNSINQYTQQEDKLDYVRFVITQSMGVGNKVPMTITANGINIQAPFVSIREFQGHRGQTDTTLYVDSLTSWAPANIGLYQKNNIPLISGQSVSRDGATYFNDLTDIFVLRNGTINRLMGSGDLFQEQGGAFAINKVLGSVIALAGDSLTFSAEVLENIPDTTANYYIFRLCKMDLASRMVRTINRTLWQKGTATVNAPVGPYQGTAAGLSLVAADLKTDLNGSIYFINYFGPPRTDFDVTAFYNGGIGIAQSIGQYFIPYVFGNICRVDGSGKLKSLIAEGPAPAFTFFPFYTLPGFPSYDGANTDYLVSQDGNFGFVCDNLNVNFAPQFAYLDLNQDAPLLSTPLFEFGFNITSSLLTNYQFLPDGEFLYINLDGTISANNLLNKTNYNYAGVSGPNQNQTTGPAKNVNFININFAGLDKSVAVYYYIGPKDYVNGVSFYKLYSKK